MRRSRVLVSALSLAALALAQNSAAAQAALIVYTADYGPATWNPASSANYSVFDRPHDSPVDMIVIHDIEGSAASAINAFKDPNRAGSAHYVISKYGQVTQMVLEKDVAWHAGNWDYNTRAIGIEHEGYAGTNGSFTSAMYQASEHLIASICSRWGVRLDRSHVIGHYQVPDPNNPNLFGGAEHHWDPGPYWHWTNYMYFAQHYAEALASPPHMVLDALAQGGNQNVLLSWPAARSCLSTPYYAGGRSVPILDYTIVRQPGNVTTVVPASVTSLTINGLQNGVAYTFTVTARNADGTDTISSNPAIPFRAPDAPATASATAAGGSAIVSWTTPAFNGGATITGYRVTPYLNGTTALSAVYFSRFYRTVAIFNLANGSSYTFKVAAINLAGAGTELVTNAVMPASSMRPPPAQALPATPAPRTTPIVQTSPAPTPPTR